MLLNIDMGKSHFKLNTRLSKTFQFKLIKHDAINRNSLNKITTCTEAKFKAFATRLPLQLQIMKIPILKIERKHNKVPLETFVFSDNNLVNEIKLHTIIFLKS